MTYKMRSLASGETFSGAKKGNIEEKINRYFL